jgi:sensor histidine kinase YesM
LKNLSNNIANYYIFKNTVIKLNKKEEIIKDISSNEFILESSLRTTKERILSIQINNHFLFNTLNSISSLALEEGSDRIYNSIINLSKMIRYVLRNKNYFVQLKEEVNFIKNYAELQKIRFGDRLEVKFDISDEAQNKHVPFNCLQPIIENSFKYGFINNDNKMCISISAEIKKDKLFLEVRDNGVGIEKESLKMIDFRIRENIDFQSNGLKMIYSKLQYFYGSQFDFKIDSEPGKGVSVLMILPEKIT